MADAIVPDRRAPKPVPDTAQGAQNTPQRDYPAEYERRQSYARSQGFPSYWAMRKARGYVDPRWNAA